MKIIIDKLFDGKTIKQYLFSEMRLTRGQVTALKLDPLGILYNGSHATVRQVLKEGDCLEIALKDRKENINGEIIPAPLEFERVYEDEWLLVVNKPYGMPVHPSYNHHNDSLANGVAYYYQKMGIVSAFRAVNRLDRDTSGLVIIAKDRMTANRLSVCISKGEIKKEYLALLDGCVLGEGKIESYIRRVQESIITRASFETGIASEYALTEYSVIYSDQANNVTAVKAVPVTGRTHQLRVHFSSIGHYIIGDTLYGEASDVIKRQALHAVSLEFVHPHTKEIVSLKASLPEDVKNAMSKECLSKVEEFFYKS